MFAGRFSFSKELDRLSDGVVADLHSRIPIFEGLSFTIDYDAKGNFGLILTMGGKGPAERASKGEADSSGILADPIIPICRGNPETMSQPKL